MYQLIFFLLLISVSVVSAKDYDGVLVLDTARALEVNKGALDQYSNQWQCLEGSCMQINLKPLKWDSSVTPKLVFDSDFDINDINHTVSELNSALYDQVNITSEQRVLSVDDPTPANSEIHIVVDNDMPSLGLAERIFLFYTETDNYWLINRGVCFVRLADLEGGRLQEVILHEILHLFGLDHSQGYAYWTKNNGDWQRDTNQALRPTMYPLIWASADGYLSFEDKHFLRESFSVYGCETGSLEGNAYFNGEPMTGIILNLKNNSDNSKSLTYPIDRLKQGDGSFRLDGLPSGRYTIRFEEQRCNNLGASSSIGAYDCEDSNFTEVRFLNKTAGNDLSKKKNGRKSTIKIKPCETKSIIIGN